MEYLDRTQWLSRAEIDEIQMKDLRALLEHAGTNVPYYRELFRKLGFAPREVKRREDLAALPLLTRDILRERYDDLVDPAHRGNNVVKGTSGSTGAPLRFEYCWSSEVWRTAVKLRGYGWGGYRPGLPTMHYWAQVNPIPNDVRGAKIRLDRTMRRERWVNSMAQDEASLRKAVEVIRTFRPHCIIAYTQACAQLARFIIDRNLRDWDDISVLCGAEAVLPSDRVALEKAFGKGVFDTYGSRETMMMAAECPAHDGLHLSEENLLVEVASNGKPVATGVTGEVVVTDLHNYGMPMIRYVNGDMAILSAAESCACGRGLRKLSSVVGRRADTLRDAAGNPVPGILLHVLFADGRRDVVRQFQAVQRANGDVTLKVVRGKDWDAAVFDAAVKKFRGYLQGINLNVEFHDAIAPGPNGKLRTLVVEKPASAPAQA
jgi:phenylacetate-CoA ligase